jgi:glycosyltransferase involved in cell wall biosynthesis
LPHPGRSRGTRRELRKLAVVRRMAIGAEGRLREFRPEVVYERLALFGTAGRRLAEATGALHVVEVNALMAEEEAQWRGLRLKRLARRRERSVLTGADVRIAVSDELAARVDAVCSVFGTTVVPNGVEASLFARLPDRVRARKRVGFPPDRPVLGFLGALKPWHGLDVAIKSLTDIPDALLAVAGDGELRSELHARAQQLGVEERMRWLGRIPHSQVPEFLAAIDVALLPYPAIEGFGFSPLKLYEYLAAGVPIVASDIGQVTTALEGGRWGRLVEPGDASALAAAVRGVLTNLGESRRVAERARNVALEAHSWEQRARRLSEIFAEQRNRVLAT